MTKELPPPPLETTGNIIGGIYAELQPYVIVRRNHARRVFGLAPSATDEAVTLGKIPRPIKFGKRASGWTGVMINEYYRKKIAEQATESVPAKSVPAKKRVA
jgi:predicted DNA-binding transcriptional regulator AlpA